MAHTIEERHHVTLHGRADGPPMLFAHGFGCDQQMWRFVAPAFHASHRVVLFDHLGCGRSDASAWSAERHASLQGYADDVLAILEALDLRDVVFVGHSVSAMIGVLAAIRSPARFDRLVLLAPSPRYLNDPPDYHGGFDPADIESLGELLEQNMVGWADYLAPAVMGPESSPEQVAELKASFCSADPVITRQFARTTFMADNRSDLPRLQVPSLIVQVENDSIAPRAVGDYMRRHMRGAQWTLLPAHGHCPHMTHPAQTIAAMRDYLAERP